MHKARSTSQRFFTIFAQRNRYCHQKVREEFEGSSTCNLDQDNNKGSVLWQQSGCSPRPTSWQAKGKKMFRLSDYDCVGFDLDNTILRYKVSNMVQLEYDLLSKYLVEVKGHSAEYLLRPISADVGFLQKGLVLDFMRGNVLKLGINANVLKASHGTRKMSDQEIAECYGEDHVWDVAQRFAEHMLEAWNGPESEKIRCLLDSFDMPSSLAFARIVDYLDAENGGKLDVYNVWPDVLDGLIDMFSRENFELNKGGYFPSLKANPEKYLVKCSENVINWLRRIKETKVVFLVTGSNVDFASFTAKYVLGEDWRNLFDVVVCYARKPGFFTASRPFLKLDGIRETEIVPGSDLELNGSIYSQGNWTELYELLGNRTEKEIPKCLYFGDNLIQDIYTPSEFLQQCDSVAVVEELAAEELIVTDIANKLNVSNIFVNMSNVVEELAAAKLIIPNLANELNVSKYWGSYFYSKNDRCKMGEGNTMWDAVIQKYSKICIPDLDTLAVLPIDHEIPCFKKNSIISGNKPTGYYPSSPISISLANINIQMTPN